MKSFDELVGGAVAQAQPYRWVIQQATCRACGNVHEREVGLMREHAPGSWIRVLEAKEQLEHMNAPVEMQPAVLAWCEACHSKAAAEFTKEVRFLLSSYSNTTTLPKKLASALERYERAHKKEHFHHAATEKA